MELFFDNLTDGVETGNIVFPLWCSGSGGKRKSTKRSQIGKEALSGQPSAISLGYNLLREHPYISHVIMGRAVSNKTKPSGYRQKPQDAWRWRAET